MKKMRWLWSYQIDKTEKWLSEMASKGYHLSDFNAVTRTFSFDKGEPKVTTYAIRLDKQALPSAMEQAGWQVVASSNRWQFVKNEESQVTTYPSREAIVKRTRMHAYLFIFLMHVLAIRTVRFPFSGFDNGDYVGCYELGPDYYTLHYYNDFYYFVDLCV